MRNFNIYHSALSRNSFNGKIISNNNTPPFFSIIATSIFSSIRFNSDNPFNYNHFTNLCTNEHARYATNPYITAFLLVQRDKSNAIVSQYTFQTVFDSDNTDEKFPNKMKEIPGDKNLCTIIPRVIPARNLTAYEDSHGEIIINGISPNGAQLVAHPHCKIEYTPTTGCSQEFSFYTMSPLFKRRNAPIRLPRMKDTHSSLQLQRNKTSDPLCVINSEVPERSAMKRPIDQNTVMDHRAVEAYINCAAQYRQYLNPLVVALLLYSGNIIHVSTLRSMKRKNIKISDEEIKRNKKHRHLRPEWLHRHAYGLHPLETDPQVKDNLGAARALDNTRMMLLERLTKWFACNVEDSQNEIHGAFNMLLDTEVIDSIQFSTKTKVMHSEIKLTQHIDTLAMNPQQIAASDMAGLVGIASLLLQNTKPDIVDYVKINDTTPMITNNISSDYSTQFFYTNKDNSRNFEAITNSTQDSPSNNP